MRLMRTAISSLAGESVYRAPSFYAYFLSDGIVLAPEFQHENIINF